MKHRHYLLLVFEDSAMDRTLPFGEDGSKAYDKLSDLIKNGGPTGIKRCILCSTRGRFRAQELRSSEELLSEIQSIENADREKQETVKNEKIVDLNSRLQAIREEAESAGISDAIFPPPQAPVIVAPQTAPAGANVPPANEDDQANANAQQAASGGQQDDPAKAQAQQTSKKDKGGKNPQDPKKASNASGTNESAADSDSASDTQGATGDLLEGA